MNTLVVLPGSILAVLFHLACGVAAAQQIEVPGQSGTITGQVTDDRGNPLGGVLVVVVESQQEALSNADGTYEFADVPAGSQTVEARRIGYRPVTVAVVVPAGDVASQDLILISDPLNLEAVVVTGTQSPRVQLDATVAVTVLSTEDVEMASPRSTTEMLRYVPGFTRVESSGGEVNQNISMRGILGVEYVMFMEDGLPVFPTMHTFFMNADNLFRPDENIERLEVVRGGASSLFGSNTPGAIVNFINKSGGPVLAGSMKAWAGTDALARYDFNLNGPVAEDWRFNIGGFYRYDRGVRDPGFPGIRGGQLKANVTRQLENGYARFSAKAIDDRNQFILPLPFQNPDDPEYVAGFGDYGAMNTAEGLNLRVPTPGGDLELPLGDGLRTRATWLTADLAFDIGDGWNVRNSAQIMQNDQGWNAMLPFDVMPADAAVQSFLESYYGSYYAGVLQAEGVIPADAESLVVTVAPGADYRLLYTNHVDALGNPLAFDTPNGLLAPGGQWHIEKPMAAFQNQLTVGRAFGPHRASLGIYFANYSQDNRWYFTDILTDVRDNPRFIDLIIDDADLVFDYFDPASGTGESVTTSLSGLEATRNGFRRFLSNYVNGSGQTTVLSGVIGTELLLMDRLRADVGVRYEFNDFVQTSENSAPVDLDGDPATLYDVTLWGNTSFRQFSLDMNDWAGSVGLNFALLDNLSIYVLGSRAYKMPALDEFLQAAALEQVELFEPRRTNSIEGGLKFASNRYSVTVNAFYTLLKNIVGQGAVVDETGATVWEVLTSPENRSRGVEVEVSAAPLGGLTLLASGTFLKADLGTGAGADIGSWINGVPPVIGNLAATYTLGGLTLLGDMHYVGRRYSAFAEAGEERNRLPAYAYANFGVFFAVPGQPLVASAHLLNALQSRGLEEGNPRLAGPAGTLFLARPLLPRRVYAKLRYDF
jgi:outer membrane receptor protein involved in Fe transport